MLKGRRTGRWWWEIETSGKVKPRRGVHEVMHDDSDICELLQGYFPIPLPLLLPIQPTIPDVRSVVGFINLIIINNADLQIHLHQLFRVLPVWYHSTLSISTDVEAGSTQHNDIYNAEQPRPPYMINRYCLLSPACPSY